MASNAVNLDALVPRDDFSLEAVQAGGSPRSTIAISDLDAGFFATTLRKPDFQRETTSWTPAKVVDLISAFVSGDLIPAVILWQRGADIFVIDGAHRLSALIAWIQDDYGQGLTSLNYFGGRIPDEQEKIALQTRALVQKTVGSYAQFVAGAKNRDNVSAEMLAKISRLAANSMVVQWVTATEPKAAEASFFKINQAAQPIDPTERRILESRDSPNAISARCIVRAGAGHQYWKQFEEGPRVQIQALGAEIYNALYTPSLGDSPIKTLDIPVAGRGYNTLPFAFDLVNLANGLPLPDKANSRPNTAPPPVDRDGSATIEFLERTKRAVSKITGTNPASLGLHPAVYFYSRAGVFTPLAFLAAMQFVENLDKAKRLKDFTSIRAAFERYLFDRKVFVGLTVTRLGAGSRSLSRIEQMFQRIMAGLIDGKTPEEIDEEFFVDPDFAHLAQSRSPSPRAGLQEEASGRMGRSSKNATYMRDAIGGAPACTLCGAALHRNSISFDHVVRRRDGGTGDMGNAALTHPYCNSIKN